eukprot:GHVO01053330.1.p1 GENE.GHVO01053330.1~~GHVO01053330.1.p1  ORF type:complete len:585 (+),score=40.38 GHVO01053330.1:88-1755(+)
MADGYLVSLLVNHSEVYLDEPLRTTTSKSIDKNGREGRRSFYQKNATFEDPPRKVSSGSRDSHLFGLTYNDDEDSQGHRSSPEYDSCHFGRHMRSGMSQRSGCDRAGTSIKYDRSASPNFYGNVAAAFTLTLRAIIHDRRRSHDWCNTPNHSTDPSIEFDQRENIENCERNDLTHLFTTNIHEEFVEAISCIKQYIEVLSKFRNSSDTVDPATSHMITLAVLCIAADVDIRCSEKFAEKYARSSTMEKGKDLLCPPRTSLTTSTSTIPPRRRYMPSGPIYRAASSGSSALLQSLSRSRDVIVTYLSSYADQCDEGEPVDQANVTNENTPRGKKVLNRIKGIIPNLGKEVEKAVPKIQESGQKAIMSVLCRSTMIRVPIQSRDEASAGGREAPQAPQPTPSASEIENETPVCKILSSFEEPTTACSSSCVQSDSAVNLSSTGPLFPILCLSESNSSFSKETMLSILCRLATLCFCTWDWFEDRCLTSRQMSSFLASIGLAVTGCDNNIPYTRWMSWGAKEFDLDLRLVLSSLDFHIRLDTNRLLHVNDLLSHPPPP